MKQGEIWIVNFSPQIGQEIQKMRPAIILNPDSIGKLDLKIVVPITHLRHLQKQWHVALFPSDGNGLGKPSLADCFQIKSISNQRFVSKIGKLSEDEMEDVKLALIMVLDLI